MTTDSDNVPQNTIVKLLDVLHPGVKVYLFGSRARGVHVASADIDLALDIGRKMTIDERAIARAVLEGLYLPWKIDIVDVRSVTEHLRDTIAREGILWKK